MLEKEKEEIRIRQNAIEFVKSKGMRVKERKP